VVPVRVPAPCIGKTIEKSEKHHFIQSHVLIG